MKNQLLDTKPDELYFAEVRARLTRQRAESARLLVDLVQQPEEQIALAYSPDVWLVMRDLKKTVKGRDFAPVLNYVERLHEVGQLASAGVDLSMFSAFPNDQDLEGLDG